MHYFVRASLPALVLVAIACGADDPAGSGTSSSSSSSGSGSSTSSSSSSGSTPGATLTWTKGTITGPDFATIGGITAMAFAGGKWVALAKASVAAVNKNHFALTSTDGKTWTQSAAFGFNYNLRTITHDGTQFVAAGTGGPLTNEKAVYATTTDGAAWTFVDLPGVLGSARTVAAVGTTLLFGGERGGMNVKVGGAAPTAYTSPFLGHNAFAACTVGTRVITAGQIDASKETDPPVAYSDDVSGPAGWKAGGEPSVIRRTSTRFYGLACDADRQIAVGAGKDVWVSTDKGATWVVGNPEGDSTTWQKIVKAGGKYVIVGWKAVYGVTTTGTDLSVGTINAGQRDFESAATDGTIVVAGASGEYNDDATLGEFWWTQP